MLDRCKNRTRLNRANKAQRAPQSRFPSFGRPLWHQTMLGLVAITALAPLADCSMAQSGSTGPSQATQPVLTAKKDPSQTVDANWIWSPRFDVSEAADQGTVYFRKKFTLIRPQKAELTLAAGDEFELFINGESVASGQSFGEPAKLDPTPFLTAGINLVAVRVKHIDSRYVGLALKMRIKENGEHRYRVLRSDDSWRSYTANAYQWYTNGFNPKSWLTSKTIDATHRKPTNSQMAIHHNTKKLDKKVRGSLAVETPTGNGGFVPKSRVKLLPALSLPPLADQPSVKQAVETTTDKIAQSTQAIDNVKTGIAKVAQQSSSSFEAATSKNVILSDAASTASAASQFVAQIGESDNVPPALPTILPPPEPSLTIDANQFAGKTKTTPSTQAASSKSLAKPSTVKTTSAPLGLNVQPDFDVATVLTGAQTGSLIAMEFDEYGRLLLSKEGGPLMIADITQNETPQPQVYCDQVSSCQGILPLNGDVFVTGTGPDGQAVYRLSDKDSDGKLEIADTLLTFNGPHGEHGPHGITLGPDGKLYVVVGNNSKLENSVSRRSPYWFTYEDDLQPKHQDPAGQGLDSPAPGGTIVRVNIDGSRPETVAGGIRNAYDLVFDETGELFIHDSDMEGDRGTTWYRPPMIFNVTAGSEMGWRSGWSKFASHYPDQTPAICDTQRGSPSGAVLYQHLAFPQKYHNTLFFADWSEGKILSLTKKQDGAGFVGETETFLSGKPLNICDMTIGQDGALYFCTGGRGTNGGVYRVSWTGEVPDEVMAFENDLAKVIRHPQPNSAWGRQNIAELRRQMGREWKPSVLGVIAEDRNPPLYRVHTMQLAVLYGPQVPTEMLQKLSQDKSPLIRAQTAVMCGISQRSADNQLLSNLLNDSSAMVRRKTCEALLRSGQKLQATQLTHLLESTDRVEAATARRLLERIDAREWESELVNHESFRLSMNSSLALMAAQPSLRRAYDVLAHSSKTLDGYLNDNDFLELLRLIQLALAQGNVEAEKIPAFVKRLGEEFPTGNPTINIELVEILAGLDAGDLDGRLATWLQAPGTSPEEKFQAVMHLHRSAKTLSSQTQLALARAMTDIKANEGGGSYNGYLNFANENLARHLRSDSLTEVIANGDKWPEAVLESFYKMPNPLTDELATELKLLDQKLVGRSDLPAQKVRLGIIAMLAKQDTESSFAYLRECFDAEPHRRADLAIGLGLRPENENWAYLVSSLPVLDDRTGQEILDKLTTVPRRPKAPVHYRDAIELGYRLRDQSSAAAKLLAHWTGNEIGNNEHGSWQHQMDQWADWYTREFPSAAPVTLSNRRTQSNGYSTHQLVSHFESHGLGDPRSGHHLFRAAQCAQCHQMDGQGQSIGPDLTSLASRYSLREMVEATVEPHKFVDARYRATKIATQDGQIVTGLATKLPNGDWVVVTSTGERVQIEQDFVADVKQSDLSTMPSGLLDGLSENEVADLFGYIASGGLNNLAKRNPEEGRSTQFDSTGSQRSMPVISSFEVR